MNNQKRAHNSKDMRHLQLKPEVRTEKGM